MEDPKGKDIEVLDLYVETFLKRAVESLQNTIANDYADYISEQAGIHRDYFYVEPF